MKRYPEKEYARRRAQIAIRSCAPLLCHADIIKEEVEAVLCEWELCREPIMQEGEVS